jgi:hypothetical protein
MKNISLIIIFASVLAVNGQDTLSVDSVSVADSSVIANVDSSIVDTTNVAIVDSSVLDSSVIDSANLVAIDSTIVDSVSDVVMPVLRMIKPGLIMSGTNDPVRVINSYSATEGVEVEAGDTIAYYGEMGDSYIIVENKPFSLDDSIEALGLMPKYLVRVVAYPETVIVDQSIAANTGSVKDSVPVALIPLTTKEKLIALKNKAIVFVKENKKPVAIGGGAVVGLIVLIAALSGGDDDGSGGGAGGGGTDEAMILPINVGQPPN